MRSWNLSGGAAKLEMAAKTLFGAVHDASRAWDDATNRRFQQTYLGPLEPKLRDLLDAIRRLDQVLQSADRACGPT